MKCTKNFFLSCLILLIMGSLLIQVACSSDDVVEPDNTPIIDLTQVPLSKLSDYGLFEGTLADLNPATSVLPYNLNTPLFSDYAGKSRFIYMPEGTSAEYVNDEVFDFPVGTVIVKSFYFLNDFRDANKGRKIIETRLLIRLAEEWLPTTYLWNDEQTEATFSVVGGHRAVEWTHFDGSTQGTNYYIPNKNDCKGCHSIDKAIIPIGPKARHLNKTYPYSSGAMNQLDKWKEVGYLANTPNISDIPRVPDSTNPNDGTLDERARAYLDINCAHCHNPKGPANNSGLNLGAHITDMRALGICKAPVAAGNAAGGFEYNIVPGSPETSIMIYRMESTEGNIAMPELARSIIHDEGVELISEWIAEMEEEGCE